MPSPTKTPVTPEGLPVDSQHKLRRVVLGGSVGTSLLLVLSLASAGPEETTPAAPPAADSPYADSVPGVETYPIPAQAGAGEATSYPAADREAAMPPTPALEPTAPRAANGGLLPRAN